MKKLLLLIFILLFTNANAAYTVHKNITVTIFWVGESSGEENGYIANYASAWDDEWIYSYGGYDSPDSRNGYNPNAFKATENPFYFALPYNDFNEEGEIKSDLSSYIPWADSTQRGYASICKNRWIKIIKGEKIAYAQWEDVGPFEEDDKEYVFGESSPLNSINKDAGLDVSPAVRDYLQLEGIDSVTWSFIDEKDVPNGPWKRVITTTNINWK